MAPLITEEPKGKIISLTALSWGSHAPTYKSTGNTVICKSQGMGEVKLLWLCQSWGSVSNLWTPCTPCSRCFWTGFCTLTPRTYHAFFLEPDFVAEQVWPAQKKRVLGSQLLLQSLSLMLCLNMYADAFLRSCRLLTAGLRPETNPPNSPVSFLTIRYPVFTFLMPWGRSLKRPEKHDLLFSWYFSPYF